MSEAALLDVYRSLTLVMSRSTKPAPESQVNQTAELAESIRRTLDDPSYHECLRRLLTLIRSGGAVTQPNEMRDIASNLFAAWLRVLNGLLPAVIRAETQGLVVLGADRLREDMRQLERQRADMLDHWPVFDQGDAEAARAEAALGECMTLEEAFAGLLHVSPEVLERLVAERRAASRA